MRLYFFNVFSIFISLRGMHQFIRSIFMAQEKIMLTLSLSEGLSATKRNLINFSHANFMRVIVIEREKERERESMQTTCK